MRRWRRRWVAVCGWLACAGALACASAFAAVPERPQFRVVGPAQGLPSTEIKALARDHAGYLWVATADGLARYDGIDMQVWRHSPGDAGSLPGNNIQALAVDARDRIWVAVEGAGLAILDPARRRFVPLRKADGLGSDEVWALAAQGDAIWAGSYDGGLAWVQADGRVRRFTRADAGLPSDTLLSLAVDAQGTLWVGTAAGLARRQGERFAPVALPGVDGTPIVYALSVQADGLWVGTSAGVWRWQAGRWSQPAWSAMFQRPNALTAIATDAIGDHWIGSQRGLWRQHGEQPPAPVKTGGPDIPRAIGTLLLQPDGALWAPLAGLGLGYLRADWRRLARYAGDADGLQGAMYRALAAARDGGFWLGGFNGVVERLHADGRIEALDADRLARLATVKPMALLEDTGGRLWLGHRGALLRISPEGTIDEWRAGDAVDPVPAGQVDQLALAPDGRLWLAAVGGGVQQRDPASGRVLRDIPAGDAGGLGAADIEALAIAPDGDAWVAGDTGVAVLGRAGAQFREVPAMRGARVYALAFDGADVLWLQRQSGLEQYRRERGAWRQVARVGQTEGMPAVAAAGLRIDARHRVWVSSARGLLRWDPARRLLLREGLHDGRSSEEFLDRAIAMDAQGVLAAATADGGLLLVDTAAPDPPAGLPVLRFDRVSVRRDGRWQDLALDGSPLAVTDREFRIGARLLAFDDPSANAYWSRLEGFDTGWVALGGSGDRVFTGLAPGHYTLRMRARDAAGNAAREQVLAFRIPPPWWRSRWAWLAYVLAGLAVLMLAARGYRLRLKRRHAWQLAEQQRRLAEQASEAKSRFLATLGHEVRTPMTGVLGMSELLAASPLQPPQQRQVEAIRHAGEHLLRLVNDALDLARIEAGKLELANADFALRPVLDDVAALMAPLAERKGLHFRMTVAAGTPAGLHGDRTRVQQILLNLVGNAIKFTESGEVALEVSASKPVGLRLVVADTGPGLNDEQRARLFRRFEQAEGARTASRYGGSGLGLAISQELAAAMGGAITVDSTPGRGTRFVVALPLPSAVVVDVLPEAAAPTTVSSPAGHRLLLVEDDAIVAETLVGLLQASGYEVVHAPHGLAALSAIATAPFDAALLDLDLPGLDGIALARMLRAQGRRLPLLAVTARSDADAEAQARAAGFDDFLRKPVTGPALVQALDAALRQR